MAVTVLQRGVASVGGVVSMGTAVELVGCPGGVVWERPIIWRFSAVLRRRGNVELETFTSPLEMFKKGF